MRVKELIGKLFALDHDADVTIQTLDGSEPIRDIVPEVNEETGRLEIRLVFDKE